MCVCMKMQEMRVEVRLESHLAEPVVNLEAAIS